MVQSDLVGIPTRDALVKIDKGKSKKRQYIFQRESLLGRCLLFFRRGYSGVSRFIKRVAMAPKQYYKQMESREDTRQLRISLIERIEGIEDPRLLIHIHESIDGWQVVDDPWVVREPEQQVLQTKLSKSWEDFHEGRYVDQEEAEGRIKLWVDLD